jgi:hypothetical protein
VLALPEGKVLAQRLAYEQGEVKLWDTATGKELASRRIAFAVRRLCFSEDGEPRARP